MRELAENGVLCVVPEMPGNLAVLNPKAAKGIPEQYPEITEWYLGGHSLGGSMAAVFAADHAEDYEGLILLAAYSTVDLRESDLRVLSIYGSEDGVLNFESYHDNRDNLPESTEEVVLNGGNHACFGSYGLQDGDSAARISPEKQVEKSAEHVLAFLADGTAERGF
jgi:predicted alpha/beta-hydrolase family hydrolase